MTAERDRARCAPEKGGRRSGEGGTRACRRPSNALRTGKGWATVGRRWDARRCFKLLRPHGQSAAAGQRSGFGLPQPSGQPATRPLTNAPRPPLCESAQLGLHGGASAPRSSSRPTVRVRPAAVEGAVNAGESAPFGQLANCSLCIISASRSRNSPASGRAP